MNTSIKCLRPGEQYVNGQSVVDGTSYKCPLFIDYYTLVEFFGPPTYDTLTDKVCFEWVLKVNDKYLTIYDWKYYDPELVKAECQQWHVGGHEDSLLAVLDLVIFIETKKAQYDLQ